MIYASDRDQILTCDQVMTMPMVSSNTTIINNNLREFMADFWSVDV